MKQTVKIGLTGVMGAGKSSVIALLKELMIPVLDCDQINRDLIAKDAPGYLEIIKQFGTELLDENAQLDAQKMSDLIFNDPLQKQRLEQILHPMIKAEIMRQCAVCEHELIVVEVPLLFEVHWESYFDEIWVVTCTQEVLLERLMMYRHIRKEEALRRLAHQIPQEQKCARADVILSNDHDQQYLKEQLIKEVKRIREEGSYAASGGSLKN